MRDEEGVGGSTKPLKARNVGTEEGSYRDAVRDGDVDDVYCDGAGGGRDMCSCHGRV